MLARLRSRTWPPCTQMTTPTGPPGARARFEISHRPDNDHVTARLGAPAIDPSDQPLGDGHREIRLRTSGRPSDRKCQRDSDPRRSGHAVATVRPTTRTPDFAQPRQVDVAAAAQQGTSRETARCRHSRSTTGVRPMSSRRGVAGRKVAGMGGPVDRPIDESGEAPRGVALAVRSRGRGRRDFRRLGAYLVELLLDEVERRCRGRSTG